MQKLTQTTMWKKLLAVLATFGVLATNIAFADTTNQLLSEVTLNPATGVFNPSATPIAENLGITVKTIAPASVAVYFLKLNTDGTIAVTYWRKSSLLVPVTTLTTSYDGRDSRGSVIPNGDYTVRVVVSAAGYTTVTKDVKATVTSSTVTPPASTTPVNKCGDASLSSTIVKNLCVDQSTWDPSDDELNIEWDLSASDDNIDNFSLWAYEVDGNKESIELWDDEEMDNDDYEFDWNGLDEDDEYIDEGYWKITVKADNDVVSFIIDVQYEEAKVLSDAFLTKTEFDNTIDENTALVFRVSQDSIVSVDVVEDNSTSHKVVELWDEEEINKKAWYVLTWDGMDDDGDEVDEGSYKFKITTANPANDKVETTSYSESVTVKEDEVSSSRSNVTEDYIQPVVIMKDTSDEATITYTIDEDAEVTVEIFEGGKSSNPDAVLEDDVSKSAGTYTVSWNVRDEDGKKLDKDTKYSYRVTAKVSGSSNKTDKERGYFVIGNPGNEEDDTDDNNDDDDIVTPASCKGLFRDVSETSPYCEAVAWAYNWGVIEGDAGFLRPNAYVNRAEALAMTLRGFYVMTLPSDGTDLGFKDVAPYGWYTPYLRTGMFLGMVNGDAKLKLARPEEYVNRAEFAKYLTKAEISLNDFVPSCGYYNTYLSDVEPNAWYSDYVCVVSEYNLLDTSNGRFDASRFVTRGEVIEALYQLDKQGLLYVELL